MGISIESHRVTRPSLHWPLDQMEFWKIVEKVEYLEKNLYSKSKKQTGNPKQN